MSAALPPLVFEIHHDRADDKGRAGLIAANMGDNPVYQALHGKYGEYSPGYSAQSHPNLGANRHGMAIIELGRSYPNWTQDMITKNAKDFYDTLMSVPNVADGSRQLHFFNGHGDVVTGQTGAPGEREMNRAVMSEVQRLALAGGNKNFNFYRSHPVVHGSKGGPNDNWTRASRILKGEDGGIRWNADGTVSVAQNDGNSSDSSKPKTPKPDSNTDTAFDSTPDSAPDPTPASPASTAQAEAKSRAQAWTDLSDDDKYQAVYGKDLGPDTEFKSSRLGDAIAGAQKQIIDRRINAGELAGYRKRGAPKGWTPATPTGGTE